MLDGFVQIEGFETYYVNREGLVYSMPKKSGFIQKKGRFLKPYANKLRWGYCYVGLQEGGKRKNLLHHRIVANAFLPKIEGKDQVNHKDGNKSNNHIDNLEWCTCSENLFHKYRVLKVPTSEKQRQMMIDRYSKPIEQYSLDGEFIREWSSQKEAKRNGYGSSIYHCLVGNTEKAYGFIWKYKNQA